MCAQLALGKIRGFHNTESKIVIHPCHLAQHLIKNPTSPFRGDVTDFPQGTNKQPLINVARSRNRLGKLKSRPENSRLHGDCFHPKYERIEHARVWAGRFATFRGFRVRSGLALGSKRKRDSPKKSQRLDYVQECVS